MENIPLSIYGCLKMTYIFIASAIRNKGKLPEIMWVNQQSDGITTAQKLNLKGQTDAIKAIWKLWVVEEVRTLDHVLGL
jgi:hypothetical protein